MSTLNTENITNGTDSITVEGAVKGSAKAWVNFNGIGTVAIRASFNVSSITDNGTGDYTVNFTTAMVDENYATNVSAGASTVSDFIGGPHSQTTSNVGLTVRNGANTNTDRFYTHVTVFR